MSPGGKLTFRDGPLGSTSRAGWGAATENLTGQGLRNACVAENELACGFAVVGSPYGHAIWADACDRVFSARCIVQSMLTIASRLDVMNRLGRALADPTRSRIILTLLDHPAYPAELARDLDLTRPNVSNHLACLRDCGIVVSEPEGRRTRYEIADSHLAQALTALVDATLAVDEDAPCIDPACSLPGCDAAGEGA